MREMKDSGIEWIGKIPDTWECLHLKYLCTFKTGGTPNGKKGIDFEGDYPWITPQDIQESFDIEKYTQYISKESLRSSNFVLFPRGTVLLVCIASVGKVGIINTLAYANQQITALKANDSVLPRFLGYVVSAGSTQMAFDASSNVIPIINTKYLQNFSVACPPLSEQKNIVTFLDSKCSEIDAISADIQKEIEILEQYKRSVITEAVTKGLNPDVETKDSGIEWVGNIPAHWDVQKNKRLFVEVNNKCLATDNYTLLSVSEYYGVAPRNEKIKDGDFETRAESLNGYKICRKGDIVMNIMLAWKKATARTAYDGIVSPAYCVYRGKGIETSYYHYVFRTNGCADYFGLHSTGIIDSRLRLYTDAFFNLNSPVPPIDEQKNIATYLDSKCEEIESIIAIKKKQMETLSSYKKSLIYEYVTGKKEVPAQNELR